MNTAIVIDPGLADGNGHHRAAVLGWVEAAHAGGFDIRVLGSTRSTSDAIDIFPVEKVLSTWPYGAIPPERPPAQRLLRAWQRRFRDDVARPLREAGADDVLVLAHATHFALNGVAAWAAGRAPERRPRLAVWLNTAPQDDEFSAACGSTADLAAAFDRLRALFGDRATFLVSEPDYVERYHDLRCGRFEWLPFLALRRELQPAAARAAEDRVPSIAVVGHFGRRKGIQFLAEVMRWIAARDIAVRWMIAGSLFETAPLDLDDLARAAKAHGNAEIVIKPEGLEDYDDRLRAADLVLLPYLPDHYALRGSGVAQEAELLGIPYVAPRVVFSEAAAKAGAARTFDAWTAESIAATLADALRELPQLTRDARSFARQQSAAVKDARRDVLLRLFGSSASPTPPPATADLPEPTLPGVDIIVTLHNYARFLRRCLASVTQQTYPNWRCVVVDDGSTDIDAASLRALVASFGPRFSLATHALAEGQIRAVATGLSLGSNPFVVMLDADDRLEPRALDLHIAWHLNARVPVAFTSGRVIVVDDDDCVLAGSLDNIVWSRFSDTVRSLPPDDAFRRPLAGFEPPAAHFCDQETWRPGDWLWSPSSGLMFRRSMMELVLTEDLELGPLAADGYFAYSSQVLGSSIVIDATVMRYTRHGGNGYSDTAVYGAGTLALRAVGPDWPAIAAILRGHIERNKERFCHQICAPLVDHALARMRQAGTPGAPRLIAARPSFARRVARRLRRELRALIDEIRRATAG